MIRWNSEKNWSFLIMCMTIRDVHLDTASSMDTDSWVTGIDCFNARRGEQYVIWFDNGTKFGESVNKLNLCFEISKAQTHNTLAHEGFSWNFNPSSAIHRRGEWGWIVLAPKATSMTFSENKKSLSKRYGLPFVEFAPTLNKPGLCLSSPELHLETVDHVWKIEDTSPRGLKPLARVKSLNCSIAGIAQSAIKRTATGEYFNPILKLAPVLALSWAEDVNS